MRLPVLHCEDMTLQVPLAWPRPHGLRVGEEEATPVRCSTVDHTGSQPPAHMLLTCCSPPELSGSWFLWCYLWSCGQPRVQTDPFLLIGTSRWHPSLATRKILASVSFSVLEETFLKTL